MEDQTSMMVGIIVPAIVFSFIAAITYVLVDGDRDGFALAAFAAFPGFVGVVRVAFGLIGLRRPLP